MRIPLSWLSDFITIEASDSLIAQTLTDLGLEVDAIERMSPAFSGVVVGKVLEAAPHPDAEKLTIAQVTDGQETLQIVCGASNCRPGITVALAKIGATLQEPDGKSFKIKKSKLRGVESNGMLCAADELGLTGYNEGIMELGEGTALGKDLAEHYADTVLEISLTPNLGHCFGLLGIARELAASFQKPIIMPNHRVPPKKNDAGVRVTVADYERCPRYAARILENVKVAPSPEWLQKRLIAAGFRPINNVVDITNYVLLELGHPLHAFDLSKIKGKEILVRTAKEGESFKTLDEKERILTAEDIVISDVEKVLALGGVMGGAESEVTNKTTSILLESAYFSPQPIRRTSKRHSLQTEASKRFERGTDPNIVPIALDRAAVMICEIAGATVASDAIDVKQRNFDPLILTCRLARVNAMLGINLSLSEVETALSRLHMQTALADQDILKVTVPTYRTDITEEIDLIEEVARVYGYNNILKEVESYRTSDLDHSPQFLFEREMRLRLCGEGLQEFMTCDLIGPTIQRIINADQDEKTITVMNPVSEEQSILRTSLLPGLLTIVRYNQDHQVEDIAGFEIGRVYFKEKEGYAEQLAVGIVLSGKQRPDSWDQKPEMVDFFDLKGILDNLFIALGISNPIYKKSRFASLHPGRQASIFVGDLELATIGEVHPSILRKLDIDQPVLFAEISLQDLLKKRKHATQMQPLPKYPGSERDWTITLKEETPIQSILDIIQKIPSRILQTVRLKDLFRDEQKVGKGLKNATLHFVYRDLNKTLSQEAVETEHARIIDETNKTLTR